MIRFGVTGCGRSGTRWAAQMLTDAGLPCRHESTVTGWSSSFRVAVSGDADHGESNWLLTAALPSLPEDLPMVHLVRSPLDHIRAEMGRNQITGDPPPPWVHLVHSRTGILHETSPVDRCAAYWLEWNRLVAEYEYPIWVIGQIGDADVMGLAESVGAELDIAAVKAALKLDAVGSGARDESVTMTDIRGDLADQIRQQAEEWGIPLEGTSDGAPNDPRPRGKDRGAPTRGQDESPSVDSGRRRSDSGLPGGVIQSGDGSDRDSASIPPETGGP